MRRLHAFTTAICASFLITAVYAQGQRPTAPVFTRATGDYANAQLRMLTPGVVCMSGLPDIAAESSKQSGNTVGINSVGMRTIVDEIGKRTPPPDVIAL